MLSEMTLIVLTFKSVLAIIIIAMLPMTTGHSGGLPEAYSEGPTNAGGLPSARRIWV